MFVCIWAWDERDEIQTVIVARYKKAFTHVQWNLTQLYSTVGTITFNKFNCGRYNRLCDTDDILTTDLNVLDDVST